MRSHTVSADGGAAAVVKPDDSLEAHAYDTISGGDWLCDQDAVVAFVREAPEEMLRLEHWGCPWNREPDGQVAVRAFGQCLPRDRNAPERFHPAAQPGVVEQRDHVIGKQQSEQGRRQRQNKGLHQLPAHQRAGSRAKDLLHGGERSAPQASGQEQIGQVGAGDQQHQGGGGNGEADELRDLRPLRWPHSQTTEHLRTRRLADRPKRRAKLRLRLSEARPRCQTSDELVVATQPRSLLKPAR